MTEGIVDDGATPPENAGGVPGSEDASASAPEQAGLDSPEESSEAPDEEADSSEPGSDGPEAAGEAGGRRVRLWLGSHVPTVALGAVVVGLTVVVILALLALGNQHALDGDRTSALAAARTDSVALASYDYRHLNRDFGVVLAHSTPSYRRSFSQASNALKSTLTRYHATSVAKVVSAGIVSASPNRVVALAFLDQKVTNSAQSSSTTDRSQVEITLVRAGGRWLIDEVVLL